MIFDCNFKLRNSSKNLFLEKLKKYFTYEVLQIHRGALLDSYFIL